jgi:putative ABC transport system permease protein
VRLLWLKAWRDFKHNLTAFAACILMMAVAIALLVGFSSAYLNLGRSADLTYQRLLFEDLAIEVDRASPTLTERVQALPEIAAAEGRRTHGVRVRLPSGSEVSGLTIGIPHGRDLTVNRLFIHEGSGLRAPRGELLLEKRFADAHGYKVGDSLTLRNHLDVRRYLIAGLVTSPEYIWLTPDRLDPRPAAKRFAVMFLSHADEMRLTGEPFITEVHVRVRDNTDLETAKRALERALETERRSSARDRLEQASYSLLERDRRAFAGVASVFPVTLLGLSGLMLFLTLWQLLHSQRKQIGILLCQGLSARWIAGQYVSLATLVGAASALLGSLLGPLLSVTASGYYVRTLGIPYFTQSLQWESLLLGWVAALGVSVFAASAALRHLLGSQPLALLRSEFLPQAGLPTLLSWLPLRFSYQTLFPIRNLLRQPWRSLTMIAGVSLANALLLMTLALFDSHYSTLEFYLGQVHRYDMQVGLAMAEPASELPPVASWPGVERVEHVLRVSATVHNGGRKLERGIWGLSSDSQLLRLFDEEGNVVHTTPGQGLMLSPLQRRQLGVESGSQVEVELPGYLHRPLRQRAGIGPAVYEPIQGPPKQELGELQRLTAHSGHAPNLVNTLLIKVQPDKLADVRQRLFQDKRVEDVVTMRQFRDDIADMLRLVRAYLSLMLLCAGLIALALVHACTTMNLSERRGEVACMLVQGIRQRDLFQLLLLEALYLWAVGLSLGVPAGFWAGDWLLSHYQPDLVDLRLQLRMETVVMTALAGLFVTLLASIGAIRKLITIPLAEATRSPD